MSSSYIEVSQKDRIGIFQFKDAKLGAMTKIFDDYYHCDIESLREINELITKKFRHLQGVSKVNFSFLISFSDNTYQDGKSDHLIGKDLILATGKRTERLNISWIAKTSIDSSEQDEVTIKIRIANPLNPLLYLQAALSKTPGDLDNVEFDMAATCVTVHGASSIFTEEVFFLVKEWISARSRPYIKTQSGFITKRVEIFLREFAVHVVPILTATAVSVVMYKYLDGNALSAFSPLPVCVFLILSHAGMALNQLEKNWRRRSKYRSLFLVTRGDVDSVKRLELEQKKNKIKSLVYQTFVAIYGAVVGIPVLYFINKIFN
jgi:hypothetical protein